MNVQKCSNGHFFDADKYSSCPHCGAVLVGAAGTAGGSGNVKSGSNPIVSKGKNSDAEIKAMPEKTMGRTLGVFDEPKMVREHKTETPQKAVVAYQSTSAEVKCPFCQKVLPGKAMFCRFCGKKLMTDTNPSQHPAASGMNPQQHPAASGMNPQQHPAASGMNPQQHPAASGMNPQQRPVSSGMNPQQRPVSSGMNSQQRPVSSGINPQQRQTSNEGENLQNITDAEGNNTPSLQEAVRNAVSGSDGKTVGFFSMGGTAEVHSSPVAGWLVCVKGKHFGESFSIQTGRNLIGRGISNQIVLSKDNTVSREKHLQITYEPRKGEFLVQPGDGNGLSYLNGNAIMTIAKMDARDQIEIGEGLYILIPLCGSDFSWEKYLDQGAE